MAEKTLKTRILLKNDTETNWNKATNFAPKKAEAIIYSADSTYAFPRLKVGDGSTLVSNLPFAFEQSDWSTTDPTKSNYIKNKPTIATKVNDDATIPTGSAIQAYISDNVTVSNTLGNGTQIGTITVNGVDYNMYTPNAAPMTVAVTQSASVPTAEFIIGTNTSASASLTGILSDSTAITDGKIIYYLTRYELPSSAVTLTLQYADSGTDTGAIPIYSYGDQRCVTPYPAYYLLTLVYYDNKFYIASAALGVVR